MSARNIVHVGAIFLLLTFVVGCVSLGSQRAHAKPNEIESLVQGESADEAMKILAKHGFDCTIVRNGEFRIKVSQDDGNTVEEKIAGIDYVHGMRADLSGFPKGVVTTYYSLALVLNADDHVERVHVNQAMVGL